MEESWEVGGGRVAHWIAVNLAKNHSAVKFIFVKSNVVKARSFSHF